MYKASLLIGFVVAADFTSTPPNPTPATHCSGPEFSGLNPQAVEQLEHRWLEAETRGDAAFLACLLAADYTVLSIKKHRTIGKAELIERVRTAGDRGKVVPHLTSRISLSGAYATAYSSVDDGRGRVTASYVDFYLYSQGRWRALAGVDL